MENIMERKIRNEVERSEVEGHDDERNKVEGHDDERVITPDRFLSIWIFLYSLAYLFNLVPYNPIILICIALTFFVFSLFIIIPRLNERSLLLYYITINTLGKMLPLLLIINHKITNSDIVFTVSFILIYVAYMLIVKDDIICVYLDYVEFIINRDRAREGAIYHYINHVLPHLV